MSLKPQIIELTPARAQMTLLSYQQGMALGDDRVLRAVFGAALPKVLELETQYNDSPVLVLSTEFLDKGDVRDGEQSWVFGYYKIWLTTKQFREELAPEMMHAPGYSGHLYPGDHQLSRVNLMWVGMLNEFPEPGLLPSTAEPGAIVYVRPEQREYRQAIRTAAVLGTLAREFRQSLRFVKALEVDETTLRVKKIPKGSFGSHDFVMMQGTKGASVKKPLLLTEEDTDKEPTMDGVEIKFASKEAMMTSSLVQDALKEQVNYQLTMPATVEKIVLGAPLDVVMKREDVLKLSKHEPRETVLKNITAEELKIVLANDALMPVVVELTEARNTKIKDFKTKTVMPALTEEGLNEVQVNRALVMLDFSHCDAEQAKVQAHQAAVLLGLKEPNGKGESVKLDAQDAKLVSLEFEKAQA